MERNFGKESIDIETAFGQAIVKPFLKRFKNGIEFYKTGRSLGC